MRKSLFIVKLNAVDVFSFTAAVFALLSVMNSVNSRFEFAAGFMFLAMLVDAFDGVLARKFKTIRPFGRYLDGFIDLVSYLIAPAVFLYMWGLNSAFYLTAIAVFVIAGMTRLSVFNQSGNIKEGGKLSYLGMPVFWSHFLIALFYFASKAMDEKILWPAAGFAILIYAFFMVMNAKFYKPRNKAVMFAVTLGLAALFFFLGLKK